MTTAEDHLHNLFDRGVGAAGAPSAAAAGGRRKGFSHRSWLVISDTGKSYTEEVGKNSIMRRTGLPARDLRVLDPLLYHPSTILGRERSIVINLEHIKAIITATEVLVSNSKDPIVAPFIHDLQERISTPQQENGSFDLDRDAMVTSTAMAREWNQSPSEHHEEDTRESTGSRNGAEGISPIRSLNSPKHLVPKLLPFEFRALEVCLESACRCLESETRTLEDEAYPALDELTSKISTLNLERVRQIKSRLVAISGRVQKVRDELEHLLDDDMDMAEMYLAKKLTSQFTRETTVEDDLDNGDGDERNEELDNVSKSGSRSSGGFKLNIEELEMLLEAYFVQIDGTLNKLSTLRDYVDDTEDYINIMLDEKQNQLLQMGVSLSTATLVCSAGIVVVSIFGMNIQIGQFDSSTDYTIFWKTTFSTIAGCAILYSLAIGWGKRSGLLQ